MAEPDVAPLSCEEVAEYSALLALDALDDDLAAAVESHLEGCALHDEVAEFRETAGLLAAAAAPAVAPSAMLRERIARSTAAAPSGATASADEPGETPSRGLTVPYPFVAAAVALIAVVGIWSASLAVDGDGASAARHFVPGDAHGTQLTYLPDDELAYLSLERLEAAPTGHAHQVWLIQESEPTPLGFIAAAVAGGPASIRFSAALEAGDSVIVTLEPLAGGEEPTTDAVVTALVD